jgi:RNA polymerase sigma-70 factor (ECF subfamily)
MGYEEQSDTRLVQAAQQGVVEAFDTLHKRYQGVVYKITSDLLPPEDAKDASQETFIKVYISLPRLKDPTCFKAFLRLIAKNEAIDTLRRITRQREHMVSLSSPSDEDDEGGDGMDMLAAEEKVEQVVERAFVQDEVCRAVAQLPEKFRRVLELFYWEDHSCQEIAEILNIPIKTVLTRLYRGRDHLRDHLRHLFEENP